MKRHIWVSSFVLLCGLAPIKAQAYSCFEHIGQYCIGKGFLGLGEKRCFEDRAAAGRVGGGKCDKTLWDSLEPKGSPALEQYNQALSQGQQHVQEQKKFTDTLRSQIEEKEQVLRQLERERNNVVRSSSASTLGSGLSGTVTARTENLEEIRNRAQQGLERVNSIESEMQQRRVDIRNTRAALSAHEASLQATQQQLQQQREQAKNEQERIRIQQAQQSAFRQQIETRGLLGTLESFQHRLASADQERAEIELAFRGTLLEIYMEAKMRKIESGFCSAVASCQAGGAADLKLNDVFPGARSGGTGGQQNKQGVSR